ncbi:MAG: ABC transporter substrate-binding protein [Alphaproteobacteria bacterium]|nr:ABC transporter substrate-binding protein [Alphaproteobacteria bacterium]
MPKTSEPESLACLQRDLANGMIDRREFVRYATLIGVSAASAYGMAGLPAPAAAQAAKPKGGTLRLGTRCFEIVNPHRWQNPIRSNVGRQVFDYLTRTGHDNVTRPSLLEKWEASPDLKSWRLTLRRDVKWHDGRPLTIDHVLWNLERLLDSATGSSILSQLRPLLMNQVDSDEKDDKGNPKKKDVLWDAQAIRRVDDFTMQLTLKAPTVTLPELLFHYQFVILHPDDKGVFKPGSLGTGAFTLDSDEVGRRQVVRRVPGDYFGGGPYLDRIEFVDLGDDAASQMAALLSGQVDGLNRGGVTMLEAMKASQRHQIHEVDSAECGVARMKPLKPFDDPRVRLAMRLAIDPRSVAVVALRSAGTPGEHHHVGRGMPDYAALPFMERDVPRAKRLLAEAGYPNGFETEIHGIPQIDWHPLAIQAMVEQWKEIGVRCKITIVPSAIYWDNWKKYPFSFSLWAHRSPGIVTPSLAYRSGGAWNESDYANPEFDKLLVEAEGILDAGKRREVMAKLQRILLDDGPIVLPTFVRLFTYMDKRVEGFAMHPSTYLFGHEWAMRA